MRTGRPHLSDDLIQRGGAYQRARAAYSLDGVLCEACAVAPAAHRHHVDRNVVHNQRGNIRFLCVRCHQAIHGQLERAHEAARTATHCKRGHEFTPENTMIQKSSGRRLCRECHRMREAARRLRAKRRAL